MSTGMNLYSKNKTEEILKWRQQYEKNSPIFLSHHHRHHHHQQQHHHHQQQQQQQQQQGEILTGEGITAATSKTNQMNNLNNYNNNNNNGKSSQNYKNMAKFYITLAQESPKRIDDDSDTTATYGSYHARDTEICMDSSDTESNSSYSIHEATVEVVEYEVASASASEHLYTNDSSSGTDEHIFVMATALINTEFDKRSGFWSGDYADTEESENSENGLDSELTVADYWVCVKCKNRQNNPMFRYCEKCYQIRKTHFPPRPRLRKNRKDRKRKALAKSRNSRRRHSGSPVSDCRSDISLPAARMTKSNQNPASTASLSPSSSLGSPSTISESSDSNIHYGNNKNGILINSKLHAISKNSKFHKNDHLLGYEQRRLTFTKNSSQLNSSAETSSSYDDDDDDDLEDLEDTSTSSNSTANLSKSLDRKFFKDNNHMNFKHRKSPILSNKKHQSINTNLYNNKRQTIIINSDDTDIDDHNISNSNPKRIRLNLTNSDNYGSSNIPSSSTIINEIITQTSDQLNCDNDSGTDLGLNTINSQNLFEKDSGVSSAPSSQEISHPSCSTSTSADEKLNLPKNMKLQKTLNKRIISKKLNDTHYIHNHHHNNNNNDDDDDDTTDTVSDELDDKDIAELEEHNQLMINNSDLINDNNTTSSSSSTRTIATATVKTAVNSIYIQTVATTFNKNSQGLNNLHRNMSECLPLQINDHQNSIDKLLPRSVSESVFKNYENNLLTTKNLESFGKLTSFNSQESIGSCIICVTEPKNGAFVHSKFLHSCCCYKCAVKIWNKNKKCPICNGAVKNVLKIFVH